MMTGDAVSILCAAAPLLIGLGLLVLARVAARATARALCLAAAASLAFVPLVLAALASGPDTPSALAPFGTLTYAAAVGLLALAAFVALVLAALRPAGGGTGALTLKDAPAAERMRDARHARVRRLLKREHEKLASANEMHRYLELATRNSQITLFLQNADLEYLWIINPRFGLAAGDVIGHSDYELLPADVQPLVIGHKKRALSTGNTQSFEIELTGEDEKVWYRVDVVPIAERSGQPTGIVCTAIDITRAKRLDMMRTDLSRRLAETLQRFNLALRSEKIVVFSQDLSMRYTWANSDETQVGSIIGRTDEDVIPPEDRPAIAAVKESAIRTRRPQSAEVGVGRGAERRWYDLHVEPNIQPDGQVSGITCASIDITHRKRNEEHMRLVMRELTHRTKNLLAVVIAIARQTSTQAHDVDNFVPALIGRLRALSAAQDLIVAEDWAGVAIDALLKALLAQHVDPGSRRVHVEGPRVILSPEASQNLGLAIHELAVNAARFGALSTSSGTLSVTWSLTGADGGDAHVELVWRESGGPATGAPKKRGFGMMVIERNLARALDAEVSLDFGPHGLVARISMPLEGLSPQIRPDQERLAQAV